MSAEDVLLLKINAAMQNLFQQFHLQGKKRPFYLGVMNGLSPVVLRAFNGHDQCFQVLVPVLSGVLCSDLWLHYGRRDHGAACGANSRLSGSQRRYAEVSHYNLQLLGIAFDPQRPVIIGEQDYQTNLLVWEEKWL